MEEDNVLTPHQKFNGNLDFCRPGPESLTLFSKFQRIQRPKGQGRTKKHLHRPGATTVIGGVCFQNVRKTTSFSSFEQKVGTEILILVVSKSPSLHGGGEGSRTPVRKHVHRNLSERRRSVTFPRSAAGRQTAEFGRVMIHGTVNSFRTHVHH